MRQHPTIGSPHATFNAGNYIAPFPQVRYTPDQRRKSDAEHQATADRLIANMLTALDARTAEIVARRTA